MRKHCEDEEVVASAKILIRNWKRLLGEQHWGDLGSPPGPNPPSPPWHPKHLVVSKGLEEGLAAARPPWPGAGRSCRDLVSFPG